MSKRLNAVTNSVFRQVSLPEKRFFLFLPPSGTMLYAGVHVIFQLLVFIDFDDVTRIESQQRLALLETADLVTFIEEILNGKLHLL